MNVMLFLCPIYHLTNPLQITLKMRRPLKEHVIVPKVWSTHHWIKCLFGFWCSLSRVQNSSIFWVQRVAAWLFNRWLGPLFSSVLSGTIREKKQKQNTAVFLIARILFSSGTRIKIKFKSVSLALGKENKNKHNRKKKLGFFCVQRQSS